MMTLLDDPDIDAMFAQSDVEATIGGVTAKVFFERVGEPSQPGEAASVQATKILLTTKTGRFPALAPGAQVSIGGAQYGVVDLKRSGDGKLSIALCEIVDG